MKLHIYLLPFFIASLLGCSAPEKKNEETKSTIPLAKSTFQPRPSEEIELSNGIKVLLVKDTSLPYFSVLMLLKTGATDDPIGKEGLANLTAGLLEKGTKSKSANTIALKLGEMASNFDAIATRDYTLLSADTLSKYQVDLLDIFSEILVEPAFPEAEVNLLKSQLVSSLSKIADNPSSFSDRLLDQYLFEGHPYGRPVSGRVKSVKALSRNDILNFYQNNFNPSQASLAIVGNFDGNIAKILETRFGRWKGQVGSHTALPLPKTPDQLQIRIVDKPELVQTQIRFGTIGVKRSEPDYIVLKLANTILGSGFSSRLVNRVRDQLGLTYHISSNLDSMLNTGAFEIQTFTKNQSAGVAVKETLATYREFVSKGVTDAEVQEAKQFLIGQFPQVVETAEAWAQNLLVLRFYGVPDSYLSEYISNVRAITSEQVNTVIKKYFSPSSIKIVAFSTAKDIESQLREFGPVEVKEFKEYQ